MSEVILIAGTVDARQIAGELAKLNISVTATVASKFGSELIEEYNGVEVHQGRLTSENMEHLITDSGAVCLVDASHPFAREVSLNAISACKNTCTPYLRYERQETKPDYSGVLRVKDFGEAASQVSRMKGNVLLATGSNNLEPFTGNMPDFKERLFIRVLPESGILKKCEDLGLTARNIIAVKGPFTEEMNVEMLKYCRASVLITKDSGEAGGTGEKLAAAKKLGIPVVLVERPEIKYPGETGSIKEVVNFVKNIVLSRRRG